MYITMTSELHLVAFALSFCIIISASVLKECYTRKDDKCRGREYEVFVFAKPRSHAHPSDFKRCGTEPGRLNLEMRVKVN